MHTFNRYITKQSTRNNESEKNNLNKISGVWLERVRDVGISQLGMENENKNKNKEKFAELHSTVAFTHGNLDLLGWAHILETHGIWLNGPIQTSSYCKIKVLHSFDSGKVLLTFLRFE